MQDLPETGNEALRMTSTSPIPTQKQLLALAVPNMLAALAVPLAELVNMAFLGHLEDINPLSGVVLAMVIFDYIFWSFSFLRMGTTGLVAQAAGADDSQEEAALFWRAVLLAVLIGGALTLLQMPIGTAGFALLSGTPAVEQAGKDYFFACIWGAIPVLISFACIGWLLGKHKPGMVLATNLLWQFLNVGLTYWLVVEKGMGAAGAGYALMTAEWIAMLATIYCVYRVCDGIPDWNPERIFHWPRAKQLMTLNGSILIRTFLLLSVLAAFTNISATFGTVALAGTAILMRLWVTSAYVIDGFALALETLSGTYYGRKDHSALRRAFTLTMRWNLLLTTAIIVSYALCGDLIFRLLNDHAEVTALADAYLPWLLLTLVFGGTAFVYDGLFLGLAKPGTLMKSMALAAALFACFAIIAYTQASLNWLWAGMCGFIAARVVTLWWWARPYLHPAAAE